MELDAAVSSSCAVSREVYAFSERENIVSSYMVIGYQDVVEFENLSCCDG